MNIRKIRFSLHLISARALFFILIIISLLSCNKKYYEKVKDSKETTDEIFVELKSGERIAVESATINRVYKLGAVKYLNGKAFDKDDVIAVQNKTGYFKKVAFSGTVKIITGVNSQTVNFDRNRFFERYKKGAINVYLYNATVNYTSTKGLASSTFSQFYFFELRSTGETVLFDGSWSRPTLAILESWMSKSGAAMEIINDWKALSKKEQNKYKGNPYQKAVDTFNEEFPKD